ncbi:TRAP transporter substrate-binding protein [Shewanella gelidii]|uniref:ABC transporter substrate-binding protein n=1 Tax=Shewanella gelidii TaxID=1642821 RepID=A0A917JMP7_9GAMM|nr:TRAP transporter substrate-binding protein [Shewanella gelidii]MCL1097281.1 TRAP transporter substrate-binding protein [Shewanella gelidii]GGI73879.1 ABC transporter substrate-binding protein [Shewanella gelidii]
MKKSKLLIMSTIALGLMSSFAHAEKRILLKTPIYYNSVLPGLGSTIRYVADDLSTLSGNSLKMKVYEPNKLVNPKEILDAVSTGKIQAGYATAGNWGGKIPAARLFSSVPFGPEAPEYLAWFYYGNGNKLHQELYDANNLNVKVQVCGILAPETSGWFSKEINNADDLKGLKMRFFGLGALVMEKLGVSTVGLPGGEIFPALEKGVLDATEFSMPVVDKRIGLSKILKYNYFPGWHQQATMMELIINKDTWNKMSDRQQSVIKHVCKSATLDALALGEAMQAPIMEENLKAGVINKYWSPEMLNTFKEKWQEVVVEQSAKDPEFKRIHDDLTTFRSRYDLWESNAFLPRPLPNL